MRSVLISLIVALAALMPVGAHAQAETDRLREALRSATAQQRSLEDQRVALTAKLSDAERERDRLRGQIETFRAQAKDAEQAYLQAVKDFNDRIGERDEALEKWKSAYTEAATVARAKDAERAKFEKDASDLKAINKSCEAKNAQLAKVGNEILTNYEKLTPLDALAIREPVFGLKRVEHENKVQDLRDKILDQKVKP